jgi:hypothetical protein
VIINDSTLKFYSNDLSEYELVSIRDIYQLKGYITQSNIVTGLGYLTTAIGIITIPIIYVGIPLILLSKHIKGYRVQTLYNWELKIE